MKPISVLLVDSNPIFVNMLTEYFFELDTNDLSLIGSATRFDDSVRLVSLLQPDIILHDLGLPGLTGLPSMSALRRLLPPAGIIALTLLNSQRHRGAAIYAGADEIIDKADVFFGVVPLIEKVHQSKFVN